MEIQDTPYRKTYDFGINFNNGVGLFLNSFLMYANAKACETLGLEGKDDFVSAIESAEDEGLVAEFLATYSSILKKEADRNPVVKAVLLANERVQVKHQGLENLTLH